MYIMRTVSKKQHGKHVFLEFNGKQLMQVIQEQSIIQLTYNLSLVNFTSARLTWSVLLGGISDLDLAPRFAVLLEVTICK
jgi:hypothetical protein